MQKQKCRPNLRSSLTRSAPSTHHSDVTHRFVTHWIPYHAHFAAIDGKKLTELYTKADEDANLDIPLCILMILVI